MKQLCCASLKEVEDYVIATGETMILYGVGPECATKSENPMETLKSFQFFQNVDDAQKAFVKLAEAGKGAACDEIEFYLNNEGYLRCQNIRCLEMEEK